MRFVPIIPPAAMLEMEWRRRGIAEEEIATMKGAKWFATITDLQCCVNREPTQHGELWHMSISHPKRYPGWDEIKEARYQLLPTDIDFMMLLPKPADYVNFHKNCFHLWQTPKEWGVG